MTPEQQRQTDRDNEFKAKLWETINAYAAEVGEEHATDLTIDVMMELVERDSSVDREDEIINAIEDRLERLTPDGVAELVDGDLDISEPIEDEPPHDWLDRLEI